MKKMSETKRSEIRPTLASIFYRGKWKGGKIFQKSETYTSKTLNFPQHFSSEKHLNPFRKPLHLETLWNPNIISSQGVL